MKNKILCVAIALVMLAAFIPFGAFAVPASAGGPEVIEFVELFGFHNPLVGETAETNVSSICISPDAPYVIKSLTWLTERNGELCRMEGFETFEEGEFYSLEIYVKPKSGYGFSNTKQPSFSINNSSDLIGDNFMMSIEADESIAFYTVSLCSEIPGGIIDSVDIYGVYYPYAGDSVGSSRLAVYAPYGSHYSIASVTWNRFDSEEGSAIVDDDETFVGGNRYWLYFVITPDDGYFFDSYAIPEVLIDETSDYVNLPTVRVDNFGNLTFSSEDFTIYDIYDGTEITGLEIDGFSVPYAGDTAGNNLASIFLLEGSGCASFDARWYDGDGNALADGDTFKAGWAYYIKFTATPSSEYYFAPYQLSITINDSTEYVYGSYNIQQDGKLVFYTVEIEPEGFAEEQLTGDMNGDGKVDSNDAVYLLRYVLFPEAYVINQSADLNGDGKVNSDDAVYLLRHTLFPQGYPL